MPILTCPSKSELACCTVDHLDDDLGEHDVYECDCYHCIAQREAEEEEDEEDDYEEEDENELAYYYHRRGY